MATVELLAHSDVKIAFSVSGHALMTLLVSHLVVSKVNLGYERYMKARHAIGHALTCLRELNQLIMTYSRRHGNGTARMWRGAVSIFLLLVSMFFHDGPVFSKFVMLVDRTNHRLDGLYDSSHQGAWQFSDVFIPSLFHANHSSSHRMRGRPNIWHEMIT
jgi:hypothetical protein